MTFFKWLLAIIITLAIALAATMFYMRSHDGPVEIFSGGEFQSGTVRDSQNADWNEIADRPIFALQTLSDQRSRTLWLAVVDDRFFILSSYMNTGYGKVWKQWPIEALQDGRALARFDDDIYPLELIKLEPEHPIISSVAKEFTRKYPTVDLLEKVQSGDTWIFELVPR